MHVDRFSEVIFLVFQVVEKNVDPETTLLTYLRRKLGLCGTKLGCGEGGCGACTVMISRFDNLQKKIINYSANACLFPICALHHVAVTTVEGIGNTKTRLHPVQERIAKSHGSQCGFCTPGIVMSMYTLLRNQPEPKMEEIEDAFQGENCLYDLISTSLFNPSAFQPLDPTQEPIFPPELLTHNNKPQKQLCFKGERVMWFQPSTLKELVALKAQYPDAKLVVGNTEVGKRKHFVPVWGFVNIIFAMGQISAVSEFSGICFGASCSLSHLEEVLRKAVAQLPSYKTEVFRAVIEQLRWFAGPQIRNVAQQTCFLSFLLLRIHICILILLDEPIDHGNNTKASFVLLIISSNKANICFLFFSKGEYFSAFKQASRREDDIAIVNCGLRVLFPEGSDCVQEIKLSYGGMAPTTVMARKTCQELIGRKWKEDLLQEACHMLASEMNLSPSAPGGMVDFRRTLVLSFFFKFYLTQILNSQDPSQSNILVRAHQHLKKLFLNYFPNIFEYEVPPGQSIEDTVGRPLMHLSAAKQASGEAVYCDDIPRYENELYLTLVTSTKAHAKILSVDTTEAQNVPGFFCFISEKDVPGSNITGIANDETIFAKDTVTCVGHIIGGVLADTQEHSRRAARAVKITYEDLTPIVTIEEAIEKQSFFKWVRKIEKGNIQKGFEEADHIVEGEMYLGGQEHFYLETHCTIAVPKKEDGEMELFVSTQNLTKTQVSQFLGVDLIFAIGVRCMLDRDEDMLISGGRHPFLGFYKVGFKKNGRITCLDVSFYSNGGNSADLSFGVMDRAVFHMDNSYNIPNIRGIGRVCKTNLSSNTAFRGFGGPQGMMVAECWMSDVALKCGLPAEEVRKLNLYHEGDLTHFNQKLEGFTLRRCWEECIKNSDYHARRKFIDEFNRQNRWKKRGMAIIPTKFGISFTAGALVHVYTDGAVLLTHGGTEMGQGLNTKMIQVASRTLGIPTSKIYISETSTNTVPNASPTAASVSADINGMAVLNACQTIIKRLEPIRSANPKGSWEDWVLAAYQSCVSLSATGFYRIPDLDYDPEKNEGKAFAYFSYGVSCSEVEIDCLTGDHKNLRTDIVMDVGTSLNPAIDIGQIEGGFVQGVGLFTLEELRYSPEGNLYTRGPGMYKIPSFGDIPTEFHVSLLRDCPNSKAIYSSKAVGEPPLFLSASVFYAIKDAIIAARQESGLKEPFRLDSPATPERIRNACVDVFTKMCPSAKPGTFKPWSVRV
uniref:Xanthine dehydrogenase n=1 Tax=Anolis carolinensis TaxID=28377 RepID=A0A803T4P5_ANOCA